MALDTHPACGKGNHQRAPFRWVPRRVWVWWYGRQLPKEARQVWVTCVYARVVAGEEVTMDILWETLLSSWKWVRSIEQAYGAREAWK